MAKLSDSEKETQVRGQHRRQSSPRPRPHGNRWAVWKDGEAVARGLGCNHWACFVAQLISIKLHLNTTELACCRSHLMVFLAAVEFWLQ